MGFHSRDWAVGRCSEVAYAEVEGLLCNLHVCAQDYRRDLMLNLLFANILPLYYIAPIIFKYENARESFCIFKSASSLTRLDTF